MSNLAKGSAMARITALVDENSFVELGGKVTARSTDFNLHGKAEESDGVITGYGLIDNRLVYVYSQDAAVLAGTVGEMHAMKIAKLYDMAVKVGAPIIGLVDCAGVRLEEATDSLNGFGEIFTKQAMASGIVPQVMVVFGTCGGGMGVSAALSDFTFATEDGKIFVNAPNTLEGNREDKCDTASAAYQEKQGVVDFVGTEEDVLLTTRMLVSMLPANYGDEAESACLDDLNRAVNVEGVKDTAYVASQLADSSIFMELKQAYGSEIMTGFLKLNGSTVGIVANRRGILDGEGGYREEFEPVLTTAACKKAADFVKFCDAFQLPVLTLTDVKGFAAAKEEEKGIAKAAAELTYAYASATVPKVNVVIGEAMGNAYNVMNSKACKADIVYAWPNAKIGAMEADGAVRIIYADELKDSKNGAEFMEQKRTEYEQTIQNVSAAAKRGYVDAIIDPSETRKYVIGAMEMLYSKKEELPDKKHGTV